LRIVDGQRLCERIRQPRRAERIGGVEPVKAALADRDRSALEDGVSVVDGATLTVGGLPLCYLAAPFEPRP
jgi:hypothetical protein